MSSATVWLRDGFGSEFPWHRGTVREVLNASGSKRVFVVDYDDGTCSEYDEEQWIDEQQGPYYRDEEPSDDTPQEDVSMVVAPSEHLAPGAQSPCIRESDQPALVSTPSPSNTDEASRGLEPPLRTPCESPDGQSTPQVRVSAPSSTNKESSVPREFPEDGNVAAMRHGETVSLLLGSSTLGQFSVDGDTLVALLGSSDAAPKCFETQNSIHFAEVDGAVVGEQVVVAGCKGQAKIDRTDKEVVVLGVFSAASPGAKHPRGFIFVVPTKEADKDDGVVCLIPIVGEATNFRVSWPISVHEFKANVDEAGQWASALSSGRYPEWSGLSLSKLCHSVRCKPKESWGDEGESAAEQRQELRRQSVRIRKQAATPKPNLVHTTAATEEAEARRKARNSARAKKAARTRVANKKRRKLAEAMDVTDSIVADVSPDSMAADASALDNMAADFSLDNVAPDVSLANTATTIPMGAPADRSPPADASFP